MKALDQLLLAAFCGVPASYAQFVPPPTDLIATKGFLDLPVRYKQVPDGICESVSGVKSYSGYVDIDPHQHIFWWFFETRKGDPTTAPLTVWVNGGPGSSSMLGLFQENGPCRIDGDGTLHTNPYSWNNVSNILYIDQPTQTGFSYSDPIPAYMSDSGGGQGDVVSLPNNSCPSYAENLQCGTYSSPNPLHTANSTSAAASSFWKTLQGFFGAFPQYSRHEFNFGTESYGGHWGPVFMQHLENQNGLIRSGKLQGAHAIKLSTLLIGNGWYDPLVQNAAYYNFTVFPGNTYDYAPFNVSTQVQMYNAMYGPGNCYDMLLVCSKSGQIDACTNANNFCTNEVESLLDVVTGRSEYDIRELMPDPFLFGNLTGYLNTPDVQLAIGAYVNWSSPFLPGPVGAAFDTTGDEAREDGTIEAIQTLLKQGVYVVQYVGDADYNCNWLGGQAVSELIEAPGFETAGYADITTSDGIVHGQVKQSGNFAFMRIYEAGHTVPFYQPVVALEMFERATAGLDIAKGEHSVWNGYHSVGSAESTYREGNTTIQYDVVPLNATYNLTTNTPTVADRT